MKINYVNGVFKFEWEENDSLAIAATKLIDNCRTLCGEVEYKSEFDRTPETETAIIKWAAQHDLIIHCNGLGVSHTVYVLTPEVPHWEIVYYRLSTSFPLSEKKDFAMRVAILTKNNNPGYEVGVLAKEFDTKLDITKEEWLLMKGGRKYETVKDSPLQNPF